MYRYESHRSTTIIFKSNKKCDRKEFMLLHKMHRTRLIVEQTCTLRAIFFQINWFIITRCGARVIKINYSVIVFFISGVFIYINPEKWLAWIQRLEPYLLRVITLITSCKRHSFEKKFRSTISLRNYTGSYLWICSF